MNLWKYTWVLIKRIEELEYQSGYHYIMMYIIMETIKALNQEYNLYSGYNPNSTYIVSTVGIDYIMNTIGWLSPYYDVVAIIIKRIINTTMIV